MFTAIFPGTIMGIYPLKNKILVRHNNYSFEIGDDKLIFFKSHQESVQYWDYADNTICMQTRYNKNYYLIDGNKTRPLTKQLAESFLKRDVKEIGGYRVTVELGRPRIYSFEHKKTGKKTSLTIKARLLNIINDIFYFNIIAEHTIVKFNADFELLDTKVFDDNSNGEKHIDGLILKKTLV